MTPAGLFGDAITRGHVEPLPADVVLTFSTVHAPRRGRRRPAPFRHVVCGRGDDLAVVVAAGPGAPTAAITIEFLAELGVERVVSVGVAGALDQTRSPTSLAVVEAAWSHDGTSIGYGAVSTHPTHANDELVAQLCHSLDAPAITAVTTDTPLRHTAADITTFANQGAMIEMECAALFAAATTCGLECASVLVASDSYHNDRWTMGDGEAASAATAAAVDTVSSVLRSTKGLRP